MLGKKRLGIGRLLVWALVAATAMTPLAAATAEPAGAAVAAANNEFAMDLYQKLQAANPDRNIFFSPYSITSALAMTYAGARGNTASQMADTLHFPQPPDKTHAGFAALQAALVTGGNKAYRLNIVNALWGQKGYQFLPEFLALTGKYYGGGLQSLDFAANPENGRQTINRWVADNTAGKIPDLLAPRTIDAGTVLVLTNAIYFKGDWADPFNRADTREAAFRVGPQTTVKVPLMYRRGNYAYAAVDGLQLLEMPYAGKEIAMLVLLPGGDIAELAAGLTWDRLREWRRKLVIEDVDVTLPRFKLKGEYRLEDEKYLPALGMTDAFGPADFSGITTAGGLKIDSIFHQAVIEVNEQGSEAAAATAVVFDKGAPQTKQFTADHPFLFLLIHKPTDTILFFGHMVNPKQ